jgi:hypothetical protein
VVTPAAGLTPAIQKPTGQVVPGQPLTTHKDIPGITGADKRGFVDPSGQFMDRKAAGTKAKAAGAKVPQNLHSEDLIGDTLRTIGGEFANVGKEALAGNEAAWQALKGDINAPVTAAGGKPPGWRDYAARAGRTALDVANYGLGGGYISGASHALVGRPVEKLTGSKEAGNLAADLTALALPFAGDIKAAVMGPELRDGIKAVEKIFSPTTVAPEAGRAEQTIRKAIGTHGLQAERSAADLVKVSPLVGNMSVPEQRSLVDYIENRASRPPLSDPKLQQAADAISKVYDGYKARITSVLAKSGQVPNFITDYYAHLWKEKPSIVADKIGAFARQGSGRSLKQRTIPTISDGIAAGLTPKIENPVENTMAYARNMSNFLATHDIQNELKSLGYAKFFKPGDAPAGWKPLNGIMTQRRRRIWRPQSRERPVMSQP